MASNETMITINSSMHDDVVDDDEKAVEPEDQHQHHHHHHHLSRLSMCSSHIKGPINEDEEEEDEDMRFCMSRLSMEVSEGEEADGELSDKEVTAAASVVSSEDSEKEPTTSLSLPPTPPRRRIRRGFVGESLKEYASENEAHKGGHKRLQRRSRSSSMSFRERWVERAWWGEKKKHLDEEGEFFVITRPKGGKRSLCMDLEEVKACRELGFELENDMMVEIPGEGVSMSCSSSGGNSPIATWKISSPGDDPRDVKARLKVWAQAVAIASTNRQAN